MVIAKNPLTKADQLATIHRESAISTCCGGFSFMKLLEIGNQKASRLKVFCVFVFVWVLAGLGEQAVASCGDYLHHFQRPLDSFAPDSLRNSSTIPHDSTPFSRCANGQCDAAPVAPLTNDSSRLFEIRREPSVLSMRCFSSTCESGKFLRILSDRLPLEPSLDLLDPPPRLVGIQD